MAIRDQWLNKKLPKPPKYYNNMDDEISLATVYLNVYGMNRGLNKVDSATDEVFIVMCRWYTQEYTGDVAKCDHCSVRYKCWTAR